MNQAPTTKEWSGRLGVRKTRGGSKENKAKMELGEIAPSNITWSDVYDKGLIKDKALSKFFLHCKAMKNNVPGIPFVYYIAVQHQSLRCPKLREF